MLVSALLADFSTLFLLPEVMVFVKGKMDYAIFYPCILFAFFIVLYAILSVIKETNLVKAIKQTDFSKGALRVSHLDVRMVMPVLFIFAMLAASLGIEVIVGAFMAGMLFSLILKKGPDTESLSEKLDSIGFGFLIPIFFIMIGADFEVASLFSKEALVMLPIFLAIAYIVKLIPCFFVLKKGFGILKSMSAGFLLSSRLSLIIALSAIALQSGVITNSMYSTLIIVAIITCLLSPVISMKLYLKGELPSGTEQIAAVVG
jgi:Kef-type K+ transport system membrane component KefB